MQFLLDICDFMNAVSDRFYIQILITVPTAYFLIYLLAHFLGWFDE